ncbi:MAG: trypsin-like peptidase domain-containing protein [Planctomycetaceae bacterium]
MSRASHLERLKNMLQQVTPGSTLEVAEVSLESMELPDQSRETAIEGMKRLNATESLREDTIDFDQQNALEAIVLPKLRPVVNIIGDTFSPPPAPWEFFETAEFKQRIDKVIPSIGRIEIPGHPSVPYGGTGFVVGPNLLMTNRHVAEIFTTGLGQRSLVFRAGISAAIDFKREVIGTTPVLMSVTKVVMIHPFWDMALLEVTGMPSSHAVLPISVKAPVELADRDIVVIGYPAQDWRNDQTLQNQIFAGIFNVKRLQPGKLKVVRTIESFGHNVNAVTHDASTLGGNSGSAVIDVLTGEVVALHFAGLYLDANFGVPTYELARDNRVVQAGVNFTGSVAATTDWAAVWRLADIDKEAPGSSRTIANPVGTLPLLNPQPGNTATWTIPLQVSITIGTPTLGQTPVVTTATTRAETPIEAIAGIAAQESAVERSVVSSYEKFKSAWLTGTGFSWKGALAPAVTSHLAYESAQVVISTARERFGMQACEFLQTDATECFVAATPDTIIVAFRGTAGLRDWLSDLNAFSTSTSYGSLHRGFYFAFQAVKSSLEQIIRNMGLTNRKLVLTGHSLGGALATVAAAEWTGSFDIRSVYTYGQPRVCKSDTASHIEQRLGSKFFRIVNDDDIVSRVPPGFTHVGKLFRFGPSGSVSNESLAGSLAATEPAPLTQDQFAALQASLRFSQSTSTVEGVGLEGFFPSFSDHKLANYFLKILKQDV